LRVISHYKTYHPRAIPKPTPTGREWKLIEDRLREDYSVENLIAAIDGNHRSPFHCGENEHQRKYQTIELIMRDASHVQTFMEIPAASPQKTKRNEESDPFTPPERTTS
jgi:hypothetical protein